MHIVPEADAQARFGDPAGDEVHYHFPVHVVVVGGLSDAARAELRDDLFDQLHEALG